MSNYARYWDLSEKERSGLSYNEVESYLDVELMERGVLRPMAPKMETITEVEVQTRTVFAIKHSGYMELGVAFADAATAAQFLALAPLHLQSDYDAGSAKYVGPFVSSSIESIEVATHEGILAARATLRENNARKQRNEKAQRDYEAAVKALDAETRDIWADWQRCAGLSSTYSRIGGTWASYVAMAERNYTVAWKFLRKAFTRQEIEAAFVWLEQTLPAAAREEDEIAVSEALS